ncbi:hypothetical protein [Serratia oryzae]|nr:hypothetical protein [Serratia oryzae]
MAGALQHNFFFDTWFKPKIPSRADDIFYQVRGSVIFYEAIAEGK